MSGVYVCVICHQAVARHAPGCMLRLLDRDEVKAMLVTAIIETVNGLRGTSVPVEVDAGQWLTRAAEHADQLMLLADREARGEESTA